MPWYLSGGCVGGIPDLAGVICRGSIPTRERTFSLATSWAGFLSHVAEFSFVHSSVLWLISCLELQVPRSSTG
jgi:hypothetical protein